MQHSTHTVLPCQAVDGVVRYVVFKTVGGDIVAGSTGRIVQPYGKAWRADPEFAKLSPAATERAWLQTPAEQSVVDPGHSPYEVGGPNQSPDWTTVT